MNKKKISAREAAFRSLLLCEKDKKYSNLEIDAAIGRFSLEGAEKGLYTTLVYGVIERRLTIEYIIGKLSSKPIDSIDSEVKTLLSLGLYQLIWLDRIPNSAAVNETVNIAKKVAPRAASFVNAVLRGFLRTYDKDNLPYPDREKDKIKYLSVRYSLSEDAARIISDSVHDAETVLAAFEAQPSVTLRINTLKNSRKEILGLLTAEGIDASPTEYSPYGVKLAGKSLPKKVSELISSGHVYIQDEASQIAVFAASPKSGDVLIDTCACPGGKSFSSAILMENKGSVLSFDLHKSKLSLIKSGAEKLGIDIISTAEKNGTVFDEKLSESADTVICDVPCSGLGVIWKKPEIRYKNGEDFARLPEIQYSILKTTSNYVRHGGVVCYSTCTINKNENERVVDRFLSEYPEFCLEAFSVGRLSADSGMVTLLPNIHGTDGFFVAKMRRK